MFNDELVQVKRISCPSCYVFFQDPMVRDVAITNELAQKSFTNFGTKSSVMFPTNDHTNLDFSQKFAYFTNSILHFICDPAVKL